MDLKQTEWNKIIALGMLKMTMLSEIKIIKTETRNFLLTLMCAGRNQ